jgi:hypothetical protein
MAFVKTRGTEDRDARLVEFEAFEAVEEFQEEAHCAFKIGCAVAPAGQEQLLGALDLLQQRSFVLSFGPVRHAHSPGLRPSMPDAPTLE